MSATRLAATLVALLVMPALAAPAARADAPAAAPRMLTFKGAIELALGGNPEVAIAAEATAGAESKIAGVEAKRLPSLHVEFDGHAYREPYTLPFGTQV